MSTADTQGEAMSALVGPEQLRSVLDHASPPLLLDVRWTLAGADPEGYRGAHLPGAVFCDLDTVLADPPGAGGRHPLPSPERLAESFRLLGVGPGSSVVVYDGGVAAAAARAWWCLRWIGHDDVRVLDGGLPAWLAAGGVVESGEVAPVSASEPPGGERGGAAYPPPERVPSAHGATRPRAVVDAEEVLAGQAGVLLDARAGERFRGETEPIDPVAGHIPGARSLPAARLLDGDGRYLPAPALRDLLAQAGAVPGGGPVTAYCGSGVTAAQLVLAAHEAGIAASLYPGSWSHWITDPDRPVATGEG
ncbi:sulfurtransferase [uncultured Georgenia sp.]|uniref:sulfurtransferase n=1 Tax=uncultured Georgenia sp. TaxID=378209 RepID=UPI00260701D9|nr:sulfurtransferase [uncultured Georgenia sp.]